MARLLPAVLTLSLAAWLVAAAEPADETLILVIRTGADQTLGDIREVVGNTLKKIGVSVPADVRPLTAGEYAVYARIDNPKVALPKPPEVKTAEYQVRQVDAAEPTWEVKLLGAPLPVLRALTVKHREGGQETVKSGRDSTLRPVLPGTYIYKPADPTKTALGFELAVTDTDGGAVRTLSGTWPQTDGFYLIRLAGFPPDRRADFGRVIKSAEIPNALVTFEIKKGVTLAVAEGDATEDGTGVLKRDRNKLTLSVPTLRQGRPARAWFLFPLAADEVGARLSELNNATGGEVMQKVRAASPVPAAAAAVLRPGGKPQWLELARDPVEPAFRRVLFLGDERADKVGPGVYKQLADGWKAAHGVLVYEFDDGTIQAAIRYKRAADQPRKYANSMEFTEWGPLLQLAAESK